MTGASMDTAAAAEPPAAVAGVGRSRRRRTLGLATALVAVLLAGAAGGWALRAVLAPAPDVLASPGFTLVTAQQGTVGQALQLNTSAQWVPERTVAGLAEGVVTSVELPAGETAQPGDVLFTVDLRPVVVAAGQVPAFRDLSRGAEGADVAQLQRMLAELDLYTGEVDGAFGGGVAAAVRAWQRDLGVTADATVRRGDVVFVPELPARLWLDADLAVGASLSGGEPVVHVLPEAPQFSMALPEGQARLVESGMTVEIPRQDDDAWRAEIVAVQEDQEAGGHRAMLDGPEGEPVCGDDCGEVPLGDATLLPSTIHVVPQVSGVTVPAAAVVSTAAGATAVVAADGELLPVEVVASASGTAVVDGVDEGQQVRVPGEDAR